VIEDLRSVSCLGGDGGIVAVAQHKKGTRTFASVLFPFRLVLALATV